MATAPKLQLPPAADILYRYRAEVMAAGEWGAYARTAAWFVARGFRCSDQHVSNTVRRDVQSRAMACDELHYIPAPGEPEMRAEQAAAARQIANETLLALLIMPTDTNEEPTPEPEIMSPPVQEALPTAPSVGCVRLPVASLNIPAEAKWVADVALLSAVFAVVVIFIAGLKDARLALALALPFLLPRYGWLHYVCEAQAAYGQVR